MSELQASNKHSPFIPVFFPLGRKTHLPNSVKREGELRASLPTRPPMGRPVGWSGRNKAHCLKCEGRLPKAWKDQSAARTQAWKPEEKEFGQWTQRGKRRILCSLQLSSQSVKQRWTKQAQGNRAALEGPLERWPLQRPTAPPSNPASVSSFTQPWNDLGVWLQQMACVCQIHSVPPNYFENFACCGQKSPKG